MRIVGSIITLFIIGVFLIQGQTVSPDERLTQSLNRLKERAAEGDARACYELGLLYEEGYGPIERDSLESERLLRESASAGFPTAMNYLGFRLYKNAKNEEEKRSGLEFIESAAGKGDAKAANNLGYILAFGDSTLRDYDKALTWLHISAEAGLPTAMTQLGDLYREGLGTEKDTLRAIELYDKAIESGFADAERKLHAMMHDKYLRLDPLRAVSTGLKYYHRGAYGISVTLFEQAAEEGNAQAMALLGDAYSHGRGVDYNHEKSLHYYYEGAKRGNPSAAFVLSELLEIYPDALAGLKSDPGLSKDIKAVSVTAEEPLSASSAEKEEDALYWREAAIGQGVTTAREATERLYQTPEY